MSPDLSNENPLISVVIPVYDGARFLPDAIATVEARQHQPLEIIVVNDGSTDNTAAVAASLGDRIRYVAQPNQGPAAARNHGIDLATGEFIAFLDVDDRWPETKTRHQLAAFAENPALDVVNGYVETLHGTPDATGEMQYEARLPASASFNLGSALFRRSVFDRVGYFDDSQIHAEDVDWFLQARERGAEMVVLEEVTLLYHLHDTNLTGDRQGNLKGFFSAVRKSLKRRRDLGKLEDLPQIQYRNEAGEVIAKDPAAVLASVLAEREAMQRNGEAKS